MRRLIPIVLSMSMGIGIAAAESVLHPEMKVAADARIMTNRWGPRREDVRRVVGHDDRRGRRHKKPEPGKAVTETGEIIDLSCYLQLGKHGEKHVGCGKKCLQSGQPIGLLTKDGAVYMLMEEEHDPGATVRRRSARRPRITWGTSWK